MQLNIKKTQSKTGQETYVGISPEKAYRWPTTHEKMLNITIREIQIKTIMRYRLTVVRMAIIKNIYKQQMLEKMWRKGNHPTMLTGMLIGIDTIKKQYGGSSKNSELPYDSAIPLLSTDLEKTIIQKNACTPVFTEALYTIASTWKRPKCPSTQEWIRRCITYIIEYHSASVPIGTKLGGPRDMDGPRECYMEQSK